uniref:Uncharacterized protein n=1 Tax=Anguilla anguilla TaxID=7936 RepID=A0A0E9PN58_ANGAN
MNICTTSCFIQIDIFHSRSHGFIFKRRLQGAFWIFCRV